MGKRPKSRKQNNRNTKKPESPSSLNTIQSNNLKESEEIFEKDNNKWFKRFLKKMFSAQAIGVIIACIAAYYTYKQFTLSEDRISQENEIKKDEDRIKYHDDLKLLLDCFELGIKNEYNIDLVIPPSLEIVTFKFGIHNLGKIDANNVKLKFFSDFEPIGIFPAEGMVKDTIAENKVGGVVVFDVFQPAKLKEVAIAFDVRTMIENKANKMQLIFNCDNKAKPILVSLNINVHKLPSPDEYDILLEKKGRDQYLSGIDFVIFKWEESGKFKQDVFSTIISNNGKVEIRKCVD
jgi:hypothetical protein